MKKVLSIILVTCMAVCLCACGGGSSASTSTGGAQSADTGSGGAASGATVMKYAVTFPGNGVQSEGAEKLKELIEKHTDGRISVEIYYSSQLGGNTESMEGLRNGTIEMTELSLTAISAYSDIWSTFSLPYMWDSGKEAVDVIGSDKVMEVLEPDVEANGMKILAWQNLGSRSILNTKKSINTPEDLNGMRIRVIEDPILVDSINAMGGSAVAMAWSECYSGLEQGTIDGIENNSPVVVSNAMYEVGKYYSLTEQFIMPDPVLISASWFDSLSEEDQKGVLAAGEEYTKVWNEEIWPEAEGEAIKTLEDNGVTVNKVDKTPFIEATQSVRDDFINNGSEGQKNLYQVLMDARGQK
ncbi:MAG: TRAP transporter substrate-binding protein [Lachnospiraceae bacterium]|nr:TRAP transporter substrate-binding protein [Lachnospiraceae bacterium]